MAFPLFQSLSDLCGIRIAYLMWTRIPDVTKKCSDEELTVELALVVSDDVKSLPLPEQLKSLILKHVKPAGVHLLSLLRLWLSNERTENAQKWLTSDMLFECLILHGNGLINQRKTAEKLLNSRMLHNVFAFRFACINFLEKEVLKLWIQVREFFLNKIMLEGEEANAFIAQKGQKINSIDTLVNINGHHYRNYIREYHLENSINLPFPFTTEPDEVLFWIAYCLSKENAASIEDLPHFLGDDIGWYEFSSEVAAFSGNVAYFDYLKNSRYIEYNYLNIIEKNLSSKERGRKQACFVFHFSLLKPEEKSELFQNFPGGTLIQLLQWPTSLAFVDHPEGLWNLIPDGEKDRVFERIYSIIFKERIEQHPLEYLDCHIFNLNCIFATYGMYNLDHVSRLWVALWKIGSNSNKSYFLESLLLGGLVAWSRLREYRTNFLTSGLRDKLIQLFISNGETVLELFDKETLTESLRSLFAKHLPQHFEELDNRCLAFLEEKTFLAKFLRMEFAKAREDILHRRSQPYPVVYPKHEKFFNCIKNFLTS